jgi:hypothetical protein
MARVTHVKSRQGPRKEGKSAEMRCSKCGKDIAIGEPYKWFQSRIGYSKVRRNYHSACSIPRSQTTTSRMGEIWDAEDALDFSGCKTADDFTQALSEFAAVVREVGEGYGESASNIEDGFGHETSQSAELREKAEALEEWANDLESVDFDDFDAAAMDRREAEIKVAVEMGIAGAATLDPADLHDALMELDNFDEFEQRVNELAEPEVDEDSEEWQAWFDEQEQKAMDETGNCPV